MNGAIIYGIVDQGLRFRYVGMTTRPMDMRARQHRNAPTPLGGWMRSNVWGAIELQRCNPFLARFYERKWIKRLARKGFDLFNVMENPAPKVAVCGVCDRRADDAVVKSCTHSDCGLSERRAA